MVTAVSCTDSKFHSVADDFHIFTIIRKFFRINIEIHIFLFSRIQKDFLKTGKFFLRTHHRCMQDFVITLNDLCPRNIACVTYLTMDMHSFVLFYLDFNKRIIQSAVDVRSQMAKRNGELTDQQRSNYRWLLIQPFLVMDNYDTAALTPQQEKLLVELAEQLPELLAALDGHTDQGDAEKLTGVLSEYFLKSYLKSVL